MGSERKMCIDPWDENGKAVFEGLTEKGILSAFSREIKKSQIMPPL